MKRWLLYSTANKTGCLRLCAHLFAQVFTIQPDRYFVHFRNGIHPMTIRLGRVTHYGGTRSIARFESYYRFSLGNPAELFLTLPFETKTRLKMCLIEVYITEKNVWCFWRSYSRLVLFNNRGLRRPHCSFTGRG